MPRQTSIYLTDADQKRINELCRLTGEKSASTLIRRLVKSEYKRYMFYNLSDKQIINR